MRGLVLASSVVIGALLACDQPEANPYEHAGAYAAVAAADYHSCALDAVGAARCWKYGGVAENVPSGVRFASIATGRHACGVTTTGTLVCWGCKSTTAPCSPPAGSNYRAVSVGESGTSCAIDTAGAAHCWGPGPSAPSGKVEQLSVGSGALCVVRPGGTVECFGRLRYSTSARGGGMKPVDLTPPSSPSGTVRRVAVGRDHACVLLDGGGIECWGDAVLRAVPGGRYRALAVSPQRSCAIRTSGDVVCWGEPLTWRGRTFHPPPGAFREIALGQRHVCALRSTGSVLCWGSDQQSQVSGKKWMLIRN